jgi:iron complex transport system substrate-binding protein
MIPAARSVLFTLCAVVCGIVAVRSAAFAHAVRDGTGRMVTIADTSRIVSIGGAVTEILYALGMEKNIAAVDSTSQYPPQALVEKKNVGYMRQLSSEGVLGLAPTLILAIAGAGPKETMSVLHAAGIPLVVVADDFSGAGIVEKVRVVSETAGVPKRGECLARLVRDDLAALAGVRGRIERPVRVIFVMSFVNGRAMVAGQKTAADGIIRLAGAVNAIRDYEGYKQINDEAAVAARPDVVLVMKRSGAETLTAEEVFKHPALSVSPAAASKAFVAMDGLYLLGFGPRTARAARDLAASLYPGIGGALPSERAESAAEACRR